MSRMLSATGKLIMREQVFHIYAISSPTKLRIYAVSEAAGYNEDNRPTKNDLVGGMVGYCTQQITHEDLEYYFGRETKTWGYYYSRILNSYVTSRSMITSTNQTPYKEQNEKFAKAVWGTARRKWPFCSTCSTYQFIEHDHSVCEDCDELVLARFLNHLQITIHETVKVCQSCANEKYAFCAECGLYEPVENTQMVRIMTERPRASRVLELNEPQEARCNDCLDTRMVRCTNQAVYTHYFRRHDIEGHLTTCMLCLRGVLNLRTIGSWDWKPELSFWPPTPTNEKKPLYIGIEIETNFDYEVDFNDIQMQQWLGRLPENLIFAKGDSSIDHGFELVSHPMEPRWALENFPFEMFQELIDDLGAHEAHNSTGTHIHMNKEAFTSAHIWKMLQIHYRIPQFCQVVGGRQDTQYASFGVPGMRVQRTALQEIAKAKGIAPIHIERHVAVNLQNEYTIELRYMAGGTAPRFIKKNMEWAIVLYEYSDHIRAVDIGKGVLDDSDDIRDFIRNGDYPNLQTWLANSLHGETNIPIRLGEPPAPRARRRPTTGFNPCGCGDTGCSNYDTCQDCEETEQYCDCPPPCEDCGLHLDSCECFDEQ